MRRLFESKEVRDSVSRYEGDGYRTRFASKRTLDTLKADGWQATGVTVGDSTLVVKKEAK